MITVTPAELQRVLTIFAKAPTTIGEVHAMHDVIDRMVALANQSFPIGAIVPDTVPAPPDVGSTSSDS